MNYLTDLWNQLAQYPLAIIILEMIGICFASVIVQGIIKNIIINLFPVKHKSWQLKKTIYPIIVLIQGGLLSYYTLTAIPHAPWRIIIGCIIAFSSTTVFSLFVDYLKKRWNITIDKNNTIISLNGQLSDSQNGNVQLPPWPKNKKKEDKKK